MQKIDRKTTQFLRLPQIIGTPAGTGMVPVSKPTWYNWIREGYAPQPVKLGQRLSVWRAEDIDDFMNRPRPSSKGEEI